MPKNSDKSTVKDSAQDIDYRQLSTMQQAIFDGASYSIISTEVDGVIRFFNNAASKLLGYSSEEVVGRHTPTLFHDPEEVAKRAKTLTAELGKKVKPGFDVFVERAKSGVVEELEWSYIHKDGHRIPVLLSVTALRDENGVINGFLGISFDISEKLLIKRALKEKEERYGILFEKAVDSLFLMKGELFVDCNPATLNMFGCTREQIINKTPYRYSPQFQPDGRPSDEKAMEKITAAIGGETQNFEWQHLRYDGVPFDAEVTLNAILIKDVPHIFATVRDISVRKSIERQLETSRKQLLTQHENLKIINTLSNQLHGSHSFQEIADRTLEALLNFSGTIYVSVYFVEKDRELMRLMATKGFNKDLVEISETMRVKDGVSGEALSRNEIVFCNDFSTDDRVVEELTRALIANNIHSGVAIPISYQGNIFGCINLGYHTAKDFSNMDKEPLEVISKVVSQALANAHQIKDLDYMAHHDSLTGLTNRMYFHWAFKEKINAPGYPSAILMLLDLDRFKEVNDTLGHHTGDVLLQKIGPRLSHIFSEQPVLISRLGGDEFTILIDHVDDRELTVMYAKRLLDCLREPFSIESMSLEIDASIGIAKYPQDGSDSHALLRSADVAMYEAKRQGGGIKLYDSGDDKHTPQRLALIAELKNAIREQQLELHYQPKINLSDGNLSGFEALVRWRHPTMGLLYPDAFIPLAELSDSIHYLTEAVIRLALKQQQLWIKDGYLISVAVNLSARNLIDDRCVVYIGQMIKEFDVSPGMLELEITETALMQDPKLATNILNQISALGVKLSIDDFGTGYSSLAYLRRMPIDILKIDREFVSHMLSNEQDSIIVSSTIALAHNLNLDVIAEGVEDSKTLKQLAKMGCDFAQGYHICKPKPWLELESWLEKY